MHTLDIAVEDPRWDALNIVAVASTACRATLGHLGLSEDTCEISLLACDDARITELNADFREKPTATNVLSWPAEERAADVDGAAPLPPEAGPDGMIELGDVAISFSTCAAEAEAAGRPMSAHVIHLIVHGTLHLLGYDHIRDADALLMERLETEILGKLGIDDPYIEA